MEFNVQGRRHVLLEAANAGLQTTRRQHLQKTLPNGDHFTMLQLCTEEESLLHSMTTHTQQLVIPMETQQH